METKKVFEETIQFSEELKELKNKLVHLNQKRHDIMNSCSHEIVFKYRDNHPRKMVIDGKYYCPACSKTIQLFQNDQIKQTDFKNSRVIPLTNLSLMGSPQVYHAIRSEVMDHMDFYYDFVMPDEILSSRMEGVLKNMQNIYKSPQLVLKESTRNQ